MACIWDCRKRRGEVWYAVPFMLSRRIRRLFRLRTSCAGLLAVVLTACSGSSSIEEGHRLYDANGCASCHGREGHGDGPVSKGLATKPRDFQNIAAFKNGSTVSAIAKTLAGSFPNSAMPAYRNLTGNERISVAMYVTSLREGHAAGAPAVTAHDAWVRAPLPAHNDAAAYLVLENSTAEARALVGASSPIAAAVEMHRMSMEKGMMRMDQVQRIKIPAKGTAALDPSGLHLMIFGLKRKLAPGDALPLELKLDDGDTLSVSATVRNPGGAS